MNWPPCDHAGETATCDRGCPCWRKCASPRVHAPNDLVPRTLCAQCPQREVNGQPAAPIAMPVRVQTATQRTPRLPLGTWLRIGLAAVGITSHRYRRLKSWLLWKPVDQVGCNCQARERALDEAGAKLARRLRFWS